MVGAFFKIPMYAEKLSVTGFLYSVDYFVEMRKNVRNSEETIQWEFI